MKGRTRAFKKIDWKKPDKESKRLTPECQRNNELSRANPEIVMKVAKDHTQNEEKFISFFLNASNITSAILGCQDCACLIVNCMTKYPKAFDHIIRELSDLTNLGYILNLGNKNEADALMQFLLSHPEEFERLVKTQKNIKDLYFGFPKYAKFFADKNPKQITDEIKRNIAEAHTAIVLLCKYNRESAEGKLKAIPDGIIIDIARHLLNDAFTLDDSKVFASKELEKYKARK